MPAHRFPPPWSVEDNGACFIVRDPLDGRREVIYRVNAELQKVQKKLEGKI
jgi:hypothetical protein